MTEQQTNNSALFFLKVVLPVLVTLTLFVGAVFLNIIPAFRRAMMQDKKAMIKELSETAWSILQESVELEQSGKLTRKAAQQQAIAEINGLRYGNDMKDYFWISDMTPKMIVHPYRPELNGRDMSDFKDAHNKKVFIEFVDIIKRKQEGYVEYYWQWKDDPGKIVPKLSYVKGFAPWQWIIGTGVYLEDVEMDIGLITHRVIMISLIIAFIAFVLMFIVVYHSHKIEKERHQSQLALKAAKEKYQALVESSSEAFILILDGKLNYANRATLEMLQYAESEFLELGVADIIAPENGEDRCRLQQLIDDKVDNDHFDTVLLRQNKTTVNVVMSISQISLQQRDGFIIIVREVSAEQLNSRLGRQRKLAEEQKQLIIDLHNEQRLAGGSLPDWESAAISSSVEEIVKLCQGFPTKLKALIDAGINIENLTGITSRMVDAVTVRFIELAIEELGEPPVPFCFMAFGSEGRSEQTLKTDQDNAIIYQPPGADNDTKNIKAYFVTLGTKVCDWLHDAGYTYCQGGNMAKNEQWVMAADEWKTCVSNWIYSASANDLLRINIFFDFRAMYGDVSLVAGLWDFIGDAIEDRHEFLLYFVNDALLYKPPITIFGNIALRDKGEKRTTISLKEVISAIVQFARIYALKYRINETNTLERLRALRDGEFINESTYREISEVYKLLMQLRFKHQAMAMEDGEMPDNRINPKSLTEIEREILKKSFAAIASFQTKISYDFKGMV
ncbi:MAG: DUF294 nucleotidyltransferase-like domain-containing protein [Victivallaceae bacterium]|nr:DUF294 nucleotidyltransferase-like domain-containing protein [Victivallaceae bacterium]